MTNEWTAISKDLKIVEMKLLQLSVRKLSSVRFRMIDGSIFKNPSSMRFSIFRKEIIRSRNGSVKTPKDFTVKSKELKNVKTLTLQTDTRTKIHIFIIPLGLS